MSLCCSALLLLLLLLLSLLLLLMLLLCRLHLDCATKTLNICLHTAVWTITNCRLTCQHSAAQGQRQKRCPG